MDTSLSTNLAGSPEHTLSRAELWRRLALGGVLFVSAVANFWQITLNGYSNLYYAAAVKSMLQSWHNFFFVSFDPGGFVTVDKPPLGLWIQTISAKIFGFSSLSLLAPEALAGIASVALLYLIVRRTFGEIPALLSAFFLAISPVSVVVSRNNIVDSFLVLAVIAAAWATLEAARSGSWRWLALAAVFVGLGFNVKTLEAYLVVPALALVYLLGAPITWRKRLIHLAVAGAILGAISMSWVGIVDSVPASQRPYVGSSTTNSELELAIGYNGIQRLTGLFNGMNRGSSTGPQNFGFAAGETGAPGLLRLVSAPLGGQIGWLLPLAVVALFAAGWHVGAPKLNDGEPIEKTPQGYWHTFLRLRLTPKQQTWVLAGMWFLTAFVFFSIAEFFHAYYMSILAPPICVLAGIGAVALWNDYRAGGWRAWLLPVAIVLTALVQVRLLSDYSTYQPWLTPLILVITLPVALVLAVLQAFKTPEIMRRVPQATAWREQAQSAWHTVQGQIATQTQVSVPTSGVLLGVGAVALVALLAAPASWTAVTVGTSNGGLIPMAGPTGRTNPIAGISGQSQLVDQKLVSYLEQHRGNTPYLVATENAQSAEGLIINTGQPVMAIGGFTGSDPILTTDALAKLVANKQVRYFLLQGGGFALTSDQISDLPEQFQDIFQGGGRGGFGGGFGRTAGITQWVSAHCTTVPTTDWRSTTSTSVGTGEVPGGFGGGRGDRPGGGFTDGRGGERPEGGFPGGGGFGGGAGEALYDCGTAPATTGTGL